MGPLPSPTGLVDVTLKAYYILEPFIWLAFILGIIGIILMLFGPTKHWHTHCMHPKF